MIDIIIPAYNAHDTIEETLFSIAYQENVSDFKVYIVNDASDKDYKKFIKFFSKFMDIQEIKIEKNSGPGIARQIGIDNSNSPYILFIDSDDVFSNYRAVLDLYNHIIEGYDMVISGFLEEVSNKFVEKKNNTVWLHGKIYKRSFIEKNGIKFNDSRSNEDNSFNQLVLLCGAKVLYCDFTTYIWKENNNSITRKNNREYSYKSISSYIYNIGWVLQEAEERNVSSEKISALALSSLLAVYYYYLIYEKYTLSNKFIKESKILKKYVDLSVLNDTLINQIFKVQFEEFVNDNNRILLLNPSITFQQFLKKIGGN